MEKGILRGRSSAFSGLAGLLAMLALLLVVSAPAHALPSYARQTGQQCAACHNGFPELTPYGRLFKLNAYTFEGGPETGLPPLAGMVIPSFTHTDHDQSSAPAPHTGLNNNINFTASLFYGGRIVDGAGAFAQVTYDNVARRFGWDNTDIRWAHSTIIGEREMVYGVTVNNNPTVTDPWNSTPAWGFPFVSSGVAPTPAASTLIEGGLAQNVAGVSAYDYWNRLIYAEAGIYRGLSTRAETTLGVDSTGTNAIKDVIPYWRLAFSPSLGLHSFEIGTFGLAANIIPGRLRGFGTDHVTDVGIDTQYQWLGARDGISFQARFITENQNLSASSAQGIASNGHDHLRTINAKATYYYDQTYGATLGWFRIAGTPDALLFGPGTAANSITNSPNSEGWIGELDYIPFSHGGPNFWPWLNMKLGAQYIYYTKFNGARTNFDGAGTNATANNTLFVFAWFAF